MFCPQFLNVGTEGENAHVTLADLKCAGYENAGTDAAAVMNGVIITRVGSNGAAEKLVPVAGGSEQEVQYCWYDLPEYGYTAGWYDDEGLPLISATEAAQRGVDQGKWGDAGDIVLKSGFGLRAEPDLDSATGIMIQYNGEVRQKITQLSNWSAGFNGAGNCTPKDFTLSQLYCDGYENAGTDSAEVMNGLIITVIAGNGATKKTEVGDHEMAYCWYDLPEYGYTAGWYDQESGLPCVSADKAATMGMDPSPLGDAETISIPAGMGFRVEPDLDSADGITLKYPSPISK